MPTANIDRFKKTLSELFMFDRADLDFGIYRIMNAKRAEITRFLDQDLLPQVRAELDKLGSDDRATLETDLQKLVQQYRDDGFDPESSLKVQELRKVLAKTADPDDVQDRIFSRLADFFARYYKDGDYLSLRRYREGVYALPYEGEEVKLYWANADQYYIKSGESFRDYAFRLDDGRRVHFKLVSADTEQNNNKPDNGNERRFILTDEEPVTEDGGDLVVRFEYRIDPEKRKQVALNAAAALRVLADAASNAWRAVLAKKEPTAKNADRTLLDRYLADYTARNSFDYFIHKDLAGFLRRELDFYIKSEVMRLDDIDHADAPTVEHYLSEVRVMRAIGHKVIAMLAQLEDFQKKLWLKKKFVVETNYCVTIDRVPEELYGQIVANDAQREEWVRLFAIDEIPASLVAPGYSAPLTPDFLKTNPFLVLDTKFFDQVFRTQLLAHFGNLDDQLDGALIHSENFQALNLIQDRYRNQVRCIYVDPPYNTGSDGFAYKDNYQHSSWMSLISDRLSLAQPMLSSSGLGAVHLNDIEIWRLRGIVDSVLGPGSYIVTITTKASTVSSFRTVNLGPVGITDNIVLFAKDRGNLSYTPQYVKKAKVDLGHFSRFVVNRDQPAESWVFKNIRQQVVEDMLGGSISRSIEGMKSLRERYGDSADALVVQQSEQFAVENADRVFETKTLQKPSPWLRPLIEESKRLEHILEVPREGLDTLYLYKGRQVYFLEKNVQVIDGQKTLVEPISDLWIDIDTNNLRHEGDVEFSEGKKPLKLVERVVSMADNASGDFVLANSTVTKAAA